MFGRKKGEGRENERRKERKRGIVFFHGVWFIQ